MTLLVISPDYASHVVPLLTLANAWKARGERVVVASGPTVAPLIVESGMEHTELVMSRGSNAGIVKSAAHDKDEARSLAGFFRATHRGMIETLRYQAEARGVDLLWQPERVARATIDVVERVRPDHIVVDHLAFAATIGLRALGARWADVVLGHPTALPIGDETYGVPLAWPAAVCADAVELSSLRATASGVSEAFTIAYDRALRAVAPSASSVTDAFRAHGDLVLYNYPERLHPDERTRRLPPHVFLGSLSRSEVAKHKVEEWLGAQDDRPIVVVSFGTFLSARTDVLARVAAALRRVDCRVALATGASDRSDLGELPDDWLVMPSLPQVALLERASLMVTHGGNNSVTEALHAGVPLLVMPFSTDQFDGAAAIERASAGVALDPNASSRPLIAGSARGLLRSPPSFPSLLATDLRRRRGPEIAYGVVSRGPAPAATPVAATLMATETLPIA